MPDDGWDPTTFYIPNDNSMSSIASSNLKPIDFTDFSYKTERGLYTATAQNNNINTLARSSGARGCLPDFKWNWKCGLSDAIYSSTPNPPQPVSGLKLFDDANSRSNAVSENVWNDLWGWYNTLNSNKASPNTILLDCVQQSRSCDVRLHLDDSGILTIKRLVYGQDKDEILWRSHTSPQLPKHAIPHAEYITSNTNIKNVGRPRPFTINERLSLTSLDSGVTIFRDTVSNNIEFYMYGPGIKFGREFVQVMVPAKRFYDDNKVHLTQVFMIEEIDQATGVNYTKMGGYITKLNTDVQRWEYRYYKGNITEFNEIDWYDYDIQKDGQYLFKNSDNYHMYGPYIGDPVGNKIVPIQKKVSMINQTVYMIKDGPYTKMVARKEGRKDIAKYYVGEMSLFDPSKWDSYNLQETGKYNLHPPQKEEVRTSEFGNKDTRMKDIEDKENRGRSFIFANEQIKKGDWISSPRGMCRLTMNDNYELIVEYYESKCHDLKSTDVSDVHSMDIIHNPSSIGKMGYINEAGILREWPTVSETPSGTRFGSTYWEKPNYRENEYVDKYTYFDGFILGNKNSLPLSQAQAGATTQSNCEEWCTADKLCAAYSFDTSATTRNCNIISLPPGVTTMDTIYKDKGKYAVRSKKVVGGHLSVSTNVTAANTVSNTIWNMYGLMGKKGDNMKPDDPGGLATATKFQRDEYEMNPSSSPAPATNSSPAPATNSSPAPATNSSPAPTTNSSPAPAPSSPADTTLAPSKINVVQPTRLPTNIPELKKGNVIGYVTVHQDYTMKFDIAIQYINSTWSNILHFSSYTLESPEGTDCCSPGSRMPNISVYPGDTKLAIIIGDMTNGNWYFLTDPIPLKTTVTVSIVCIGTNVTIMVDGKNYNYKKQYTQPSTRPTGLAIVYASDPFYVSASTDIKNFYYESSPNLNKESFTGTNNNPVIESFINEFVTSGLEKKITDTAKTNSKFDANDLSLINRRYNSVSGIYNSDVGRVLKTKNSIDTKLNNYGEVKRRLSSMNPEVTKQLIAMEDEKRLHLKSVKARYLLWKISLILASIVVIIYFLTKIKGMLANINNPIPA